MCNQLFQGTTVGLEQVLTTRAERVEIQKEMLSMKENTVLLCATLNTPRPVRYSVGLAELFEQIIETVEDAITLRAILRSCRKEVTGSEYYLLLSIPEKEAKETMLETKERRPFGRLVDLDILCLVDRQPNPISRSNLDHPPRAYYLYQEQAKICGRSRKYSMKEMQEAILLIIAKRRGKNNGKKNPVDGNSLT